MRPTVSNEALTKRIKRHVIGRPHTFFAVTAPGLERLCLRELATIPGTVAQAAAVPGGVEFEGRLTDLYGASLDLRTPTRILMRLAAFKATNFRQLEKQLGRLPWELYLPPDVSLKISVKTAHSRLYHTEAIARHLEQAVVTRLADIFGSRSGGNSTKNMQTVHARVLDDNFLVSLDSSGLPLYKRGLKTDVGKAPLRETLAAAVLTWAGYRGRGTLLDPMCGSGTFSLEAALMSNRTPPGWYRSFAFMHWPAFKSGQWQYLKKERSQRIRPPERAPEQAKVFAADIDPDMCKALAAVVRQHDLAEIVSVDRADFFGLMPKAISPQPGTVALNPPYGLRLGPSRETDDLYGDIAGKLKKDFKRWRLAIILPDKRLAALFPSHLRPRSIPHGGLSLTLLTGTIV
ncbi:MAG: RNA methyltransferase [Deltaproteobacteria bacterium]|nr:RNA methyltransferase [Deltaproteobacteria bacterium]